MRRRRSPLALPTPLSPDTRDMRCQQTVHRPGCGRERWTAPVHPDDVSRFSRLSLELGAVQGDGTVIALSTAHEPLYLSPLKPLN